MLQSRLENSPCFGVPVPGQVLIKEVRRIGEACCVPLPFFLAQLHALIEELLLSLDEQVLISKRNQNCCFPRESSSVQIDIKVIREEVF
jgi:hypothetical protein